MIRSTLHRLSEHLRGQSEDRRPKLEALARSSGDPFRVSDYYAIAEAHMDGLWGRLIWPRIQGSDFTRVLDLAAGHGRNSARLSEFADELILADINEECLSACRERFGADPRFTYVRTDGYTLKGVPDDHVTLVYSFDSMVHFDPAVVESYLSETARVLAPGGTAFFHHSNHALSPDGDFRDAPHWRNHMSLDLFAELSAAAGLDVVRSESIDWGGADDLCRHLDGLTTLRLQSLE